MTLEDILKLEDSFVQVKKQLKAAKRVFLQQHALYKVGEIVWSPYGRRVWISDIDLYLESTTEYKIKYQLSKVNKAGRKLKSKVSGIYYPEQKITKYD